MKVRKIRPKVAFWWGWYDETGKLRDVVERNDSRLSGQGKPIIILCPSRYRQLLAMERLGEELCFVTKPRDTLGICRIGVPEILDKIHKIVVRVKKEKEGE